MGLGAGIGVLAAAVAVAAGAPSDLPVMDGVPTAAADEVGMSAARLERLDRVMQGYVDRREVAGVVSLVARRGKVVHFSTFGDRDAEAGAPMGHDTIFRIASMTKPVASVALMMLYEEGHFQLRDPIAKWLPEFADMQVASDGDLSGVGPRAVTGPSRPSQPITVQHVLTHTAGLPNTYRGIMKPDFDAIAPQREPGDTLDAFVTRLSALPLNFHPGERWEYGRATDVVGRLVEVMSGMRFDRFLQAADLRAAGHGRHALLPAGRQAGPFRRAVPAGKEGGGLALTEAPSADSRFVREPHSYFSGAGGLASTARDYFRFQQMMLNGGALDGVRILGRKTVDLITLNHVGDHGRSGSSGRVTASASATPWCRIPARPPCPTRPARTSGGARTTPRSGSIRRRSW